MRFSIKTDFEIYFFLTITTDPTNMGITKLTSQMQSPANAMLTTCPEKAPITSTAYELRTAASENAKDGVKVTNK